MHTGFLTKLFGHAGKNWGLWKMVSGFFSYKYGLVRPFEMVLWKFSMFFSKLLALIH